MKRSKRKAIRSGSYTPAPNPKRRSAWYLEGVDWDTGRLKISHIEQNGEYNKGYIDLTKLEKGDIEK